MKIGNQHGGKREGAGRIPKWDPLFKLHVGQDCEELFKREKELVIEQAKNKLFGQETDLKEQWQHTNRIPIEQRSAWLKSEEADRHQFDIEQRGFSIRGNGPLDMRMDTTKGFSAAEFLNKASEKEISEVLYKYGEEKASRKIARVIVQHRAKNIFRINNGLFCYFFNILYNARVV